MIIKFIVILLCFFIASFNNKNMAGTIDPNTQDTKYIEYAQNFHYVLKLEGKSDKDEKVCASCVAINEEWIITAAHVIKEMPKCHVIYEEKIIPIKIIIVHGDFQNNGFGVGDIALCKLSNKLNLSFYPQLYENQDEIGKVCSISGFGITGNFITGSQKGDGKKRSGSNIIDTIYQDLLICSPSSTNESKTSLEFLIAHGDSGGGLFIDNKLAGINSCVLASDGNPNSSYKDESGHTRISKYIEWIKKHINDN